MTFVYIFAYEFVFGLYHSIHFKIIIYIMPCASLTNWKSFFCWRWRNPFRNVQRFHWGRRDMWKSGPLGCCSRPQDPLKLSPLVPPDACWRCSTINVTIHRVPPRIKTSSRLSVPPNSTPCRRLATPRRYVASGASDLHLTAHA